MVYPEYVSFAISKTHRTHCIKELWRETWSSVPPILFPKPCKHGDDETDHCNSLPTSPTQSPPPPGTISFRSTWEWGNQWIKSSLAQSASNNITADLLHVHHGRLGRRWWLSSDRGSRARKGSMELLAARVEWSACDELSDRHRIGVVGDSAEVHYGLCCAAFTVAFPPRRTPWAEQVLICLSLI